MASGKQEGLVGYDIPPTYRAVNYLCSHSGMCVLSDAALKRVLYKFSFQARLAKTSHIYTKTGRDRESKKGSHTSGHGGLLP